MPHLTRTVAGGASWNGWTTSHVPQLRKAQRPDGSWGEGKGAELETALRVLTLLTPTSTLRLTPDK